MIVDQLVEEYDYDKFQKDVQRLASNYREELKAYVIGESHDGREIYMLEIGHGPIPVIITAGVHARETINTKVVMAMIENYLELAINGEVAISDFGMRDRLNIIHSRPRYGKVFYELNPDEYRNELDQLRYGNPVSILYDTAESKRETGQRLRNQRIEKEFPDRYTQEIIYAGPKNGVNNGENMSLSDIVIRDRIPYIANTNKKGEYTPSEYDIRWYLDHYTFYFIPLLNPDGYEIALKGFDSIRDDELRKSAKEMGIDSKEWKYNARGVDINRNFPSKTWQAKERNLSPGSENETQALMRVFSQIPAEGYLDLHSRGKVIYYYRHFMDDAYNRRQKYIADRLIEVTGYELMPPEDEIEMYDTGGNTVHYFSEQFGKPALTIETVPEEATFPLNRHYVPQAFREIYFVPFEFVDAIAAYD